MPKKSNTALEKYNKETPDSENRKAYKQMIDDEFNDARKQVIRRQFDQVGLYNEIFDKSRISMGNTVVEVEIADLFRKYLESIKIAEMKLNDGKNQPFDEVLTNYSTLANKLSAYVSATTQTIDVKQWTDALRNSAPELQKLLADGLNRLGVGKLELVHKGTDKLLTPPNVSGFLSVTEPRWKEEERALKALEDAGVPVTPENIQKALESMYGKPKPNNSAQSGLPSEKSPTEKDLINLFLLIEKVSVGYIQGSLQGYDTLSPEQKKNLKSKIGLFKDESRNLKIQKEEDLRRFDLSIDRANQPSAIRNSAEYRMVIANLEALKKETIEKFQSRNESVFGSYRPNEPQELAEIIKNFDDAIEQVKSNWVSKLPALDKVEDILRKTQKEREREGLVERRPYGDVAPLPEEPPAVGPPRRGRPPKEGLPDRPVQGPVQGQVPIALPEGQAPPPRRGRPTKGGPAEQAPAQISDADKIRYFGQWFSTLTQAQKEALPTFDDIDHAYRTALENRAFEGFGKKRGKGKSALSVSDIYWIMKALGGGKAHGKAHGGQAGFSMEKTREIVDQWPNFPYYVPPASKTGSMLKNPRSRVHIPTEGNGKPKRGRPAKGGILPVVAMIGKQIVKHVVKDQIKKAVKGAVQGKPGNPNTMPPPTSSPQANAHYCRTRARQGIKDPACGGAKKKAKKRGKPAYDVI